jgi:hypothetical protein
MASSEREKEQTTEGVAVAGRTGIVGVNVCESCEVAGCGVERVNAPGKVDVGASYAPKNRALAVDGIVGPIRHRASSKTSCRNHVFFCFVLFFFVFL